MSERPLTILERLEHRVACTLLRLPPALLVRLSGKPPVVEDGLTLHPEVQLLLTLRERLGAVPLSGLTPQEGRRRLRREALVHAGERVEVAAVRDLVLDTAKGPLKARHYAPVEQSEQRPLLLFLHGGGFVLGDLETHDSACRLLCRHAGVHVLAVDYRLAPEHPFPAALEDASAAFTWACAHAQELGADPARIAVGGDSAGGNLAAALSQLAVREGIAVPSLQLLLYPALDRTVDRASIERFAEGFFLSRADISWFHQHYTGASGVDCSDPRLSPLLCRELSGLPPALVITAGFDPLRDEGEAYAAALQAAGTPVTLRRYDGFVHGFINMTGVSPACRAAVLEIASMLRHMLEKAPAATARGSESAA
ncbi:MAG TPA: alpha/beta hydrolase [Myxococcaceae bacterium]|jgi:acetyl esterase